MAQHKYGEGAKRMCPYCGQESRFSSSTSAPQADAPKVAPGKDAPPVTYKPGWTCSNKNCSHRYDFNL